MIKYNESTKCFNIESGNSSYIFHVSTDGYLIHDYYGMKTEGSFNYMNSVSEFKRFKRPEMDFDETFNVTLQETGIAERGDFRTPSVIIERNDGAIFSRFKYDSYRIYEGAPSLKGQPHVRGAKETLEITLKDDFSDAVLIQNYTVYDELSAIVRGNVIINKGKETFKIRKAASFMVDYDDSDFNLIKLPGSWARERELETSKIGKGIEVLRSNGGTSSHLMNPFIAVERRNTTEKCGECYGFNLVYSGQFSIELESNYLDYLRIVGGINDFNFGWILNPGESFETPEAVMVYSFNGLSEMSRTFHDLYRKYLINPSYVYKERPIVINNWEATYFDFNYEKLFKLADKASKIGVNTFVLDDGWFGHRNDDKTSLGDWFIFEDKLKDGLKPIIDYVNERGMKFGLWFEPEMVSEDSELYKLHPEWALCRLNTEPSRHRNQLVLDFSNKEVVDYVYNEITNILDNNHIEYVKWDHNRTLTEFYSNSLDASHMGEVFHRYVLGFYDLAERLLKRYPDIFFEGCAGGGGRFDPAAMYYFAQIWTSDDTDSYERSKIQYSTSLCYPLSAMSCHVSKVPNEQTGRVTKFKSRVDIASLGSYGYELNLPDLTNEELKIAKEGIKEYKKHSDLILHGDLYRLSSPYDSNFFAVEVLSKDKKKGYVVIEQILTRPNDTRHRIRLEGLALNKKYYVEELDEVLTSSELLNFGLSMNIKGDFTTITYNLKEVK